MGSDTAEKNSPYDWGARGEDSPCEGADQTQIFFYTLNPASQTMTVFRLP